MEITEDELVEVQIGEQHLLELIVSPYNISRAIRKVMPNGTYGGVRGRKTKEIGGKLRKSFVFLLLDFSRPAPSPVSVSCRPPSTKTAIFVDELPFLMCALFVGRI